MQKYKERRFLTASPILSLEQLTKSITSVFKVMFQIVQNCSNKCRHFSGVNNFCTVLNTKAVIIKISNLNKSSKGESRMTFYFIFLYTKIRQSKLLKVLSELTDSCFDGDSHKYISVNRFVNECKYVYDTNNYSVVFDKSCFKKEIK